MIESLACNVERAKAVSRTAGSRSCLEWGLWLRGVSPPAGWSIAGTA